MPLDHHLLRDSAGWFGNMCPKNGEEVPMGIKRRGS